MSKLVPNFAAGQKQTQILIQVREPFGNIVGDHYYNVSLDYVAIVVDKFEHNRSTI
jgi:hypothetical protein